MRLLLVTDEFKNPLTGSGGVARQIASFASGTFHVDVVSEQDDSNKVFGELIPVLGYFIRSGKYRSLVTQKLTTGKYDVVLFNDVWFAYAMQRMLKAMHRKMAVIAFMHDDNTLAPTTQISGGKQLSLRVRRYLEQRVIPSLDALLTNSEYMKALLQAKYPKQKVYSMPYAARDYAMMDFRSMPLDSAREIRVLFIKSDYERGGLRRLILALQQLKEYSFQLTIAGPEETDVRERLGDMLNANAQLKFHFAGPVTQADTVMNLYHTHHLVCVPSEREALGLVNAEALASGTPVVSVRVGGIPEILADGKAGWLASENTVPALAAAIRGCITHRAETQQKAMFGREHVLKKYSITSFRSAFMVALRDIMSKKSSE